MNLYHWHSKLMQAYGSGDIIVMADSVEEARDKARSQWAPFEEGPTEDVYLTLLRDTEDEDYYPVYGQRLSELNGDLAKEPTIVESGVLFIRGSD